MACSALAEETRLTRRSVMGKWEGIETNGLNCIVIFDETKGRVHTFRQGKQLGTINFWWNIESNGTNIILGVNGSAHKLQNDQLQLRLRPVNTNLTTVRDVVLTRAIGGNRNGISPRK